MSDLPRNNLHSHPGGHVTPWLDAYHDGEVAGELRAQIEAHLAACQECRAELDELGDLSNLLQSSPPLVPWTTDAAFARQVVNRLERPQQPRYQRYVKLAWRYAPLFLFAAWVFSRTIGWVFSSAAVGQAIFPDVGAKFQALLPVNSAQTSWIGDLLRMSLPQSFVLQAFGEIGRFDPVGSFLLVNLTNIAFLVVLAFLFASWLASWWIYHTRHQAGGGVSNI